MAEPALAQTTAPGPAAGKVAAGEDHLQDSLMGAQLQGDASTGGGAPGGPDGAEIAIFLLEEMEQGNPDPMAGLSGESTTAAAPVMAILRKNRAFVDRCIKEGVERVQGGSTEWVRPAPAHAIAGFLGLAPRDPSYRAPK